MDAVQCSCMQYVVGLGNPGEKYRDTRHNVGWQVLDAFVRTVGLPTPHDSVAASGRVSEGAVSDQPVTVLYPDTYMNNSGQAVKKVVPPNAAAQTVVVYDDIDLPFGQVKVSVGGGAGGHNGVRSVQNALGTPGFVRVRIGIAPKHFLLGTQVRPTGAKLPQFVLKPFTGRERKQLPAVLDRAAAALRSVLVDGPTAAMNQYNQRG